MSLPRNVTDAGQPFTNTSVVRPSPSWAQSGVSIAGAAPAIALELPATLAAPAECVPPSLPPAVLAAPARFAAPPFLPPAALSDDASFEPQPMVSAAITIQACNTRHEAVDQRMSRHGDRVRTPATSSKRHAGALYCRTVRAAGTLDLRESLRRVPSGRERQVLVARPTMTSARRAAGNETRNLPPSIMGRTLRQGARAELDQRPNCSTELPKVATYALPLATTGGQNLEKKL